MKKIIVALVAVAMAAPVAAFAADQASGLEVRSKVAAESCCPQSYSIPERITKLQNELNRGDAVYSKEELKKMRSELEEDQLLMVNLLKN